MATESSAVVRFIAAAQQSNQPIQESPDALPEFTDDVRMVPPVRRSVRILRLVLILVSVLAIISSAVVAGVYIGKRGSGDKAAPAAARAASAPAAPPSAPAAADAAPAASTSAAPTSAAPAAAPVAGAVPAAVLAETGFDVRVKPPGMVSLDGRVLGRAPLRVRNLLPGKHLVEIQAPEGFVSRRVEIDLAAGEPQNVNLTLDPVAPIAAAAAAGAAKPEGAAGAAKTGAGATAEAGAKTEGAATTAAGAATEPGAKSAAVGPAAKPAAAEPAEKTERPAKAAAPARRNVRRAPRRASREAPAEVQAADIDAIGTLMLGSKPPCDIYIDGAATGLKTPQRSIQLAAGTHQIRLVHPDLAIEKSFTVDVKAGQITRSIHDLTGKL